MCKQWVSASVFFCLLNSMVSCCFSAPQTTTHPRTSIHFIGKTLPSLARMSRFQAAANEFEQASTSSDIISEEQEFIIRINADRAIRGLRLLAIDPFLVNLARQHSREMCDLNYFDHHSPTPGMRTPMDRYLKDLHDTGAPTPRYVLCGENLYYCSLCSNRYDVSYAHTALMNSPGHRANILEPRYRTIGVGVYKDVHGQFWVSEEFLSDRD